MKRILVIDDCLETQHLIQLTCRDFYQVHVHDGSPEKCLKTIIETESPELILLDINFPNQTGFDLFKQIRSIKTAADTPILFLSGNKNIESKVKGFEIGADDYIEKPFHPQELIARINARLKVTSLSRPETLVKGPFSLNLEKHSLALVDREKGELVIELTSIEFKLLKFLMLNANQILTRAMILDKIWSDSIHVSDRTIDVHLSTIRKKHRYLKKAIKSVYGEGYRFNYDVVLFENAPLSQVP
jgi:two-component system OmpR family response regulator